MRAISLRLVLAGALSLLATAAQAAQTWQGAAIMPKSDGLVLQAEIGGTSSGNVYLIEWPATVVKNNGRWLSIRDSGGYSKGKVSGWVYADDVVRLEGAGDYYTEQLRSGDKAWLYWLRGIYWEQQGQVAIAQADYLQAIELPSAVALDDVRIRMGRLVANAQFQDGKGAYDEAQRHNWEQYFQDAMAINADRPQLYLDWGYALSQACLCGQKTAAESVPAPAPTDANAAKQSATILNSDATGTAANGANGAPPKPADGSANPSNNPAPKSLSEQAADQYKLAASKSNKWWRVPFQQAELVFSQCDQESIDGMREPNGSRATPQALNDAETNFNLAISWYSNSCDAYRDLSEIVRLQAKAPGKNYRLEEARQLATAACTISNYRDAASLRTLAQVYADLNDYEQALDYSERAAKAAVEVASANRMVRMWICYHQKEIDQVAADKAAKQALANSQQTHDSSKPPIPTIAVEGPFHMPKGGGNIGVDPRKPATPDATNPAPTAPTQPAKVPLLPPGFILQSHSAYR